MSFQNTIAAVLITFLFFACQEKESQTNVANTDGFDRMRDSIQMIYDHQTDFLVNIYENDKRIEALKANLNKSESGLNEYFKLAIEYINNGQTEQALQVINDIAKMAPPIRDINENTLMFHKFLGMCYLRLAEQNNCIHNHNDESCIVPIMDGGIHIDKRGSELAIEKYQEILSFFPEDMESRWLLNIAYMTLDGYPEAVPEQYLIPLPEQSSDIGPMENIATRTGLDYNDLSGGVILDDFNNDQLLDIIISSWSFSGKIRYFQNQGGQGFKDLTEESKLDKAYGGLNIKQADYNNDGHMDFVILRGAWKADHNWGIPSNSLIRNNGDGTFSDVTFDAGLYSRRPTQSAEWVDFNNDGWVDLFIANETTSSSKTKFPCELYQNNGDGTFSENAVKYGIDYIGYFKGVSSGDINNDGWPDIFLSNLDGKNVLLLNQFKDDPENPFRNITTAAGVEMPYAAFPAWFFDFNNDGWDDLYVSSYGQQAFMDQAGQFANDMLGKEVQSESNKLYLNRGDLTFKDVTDDYFNMKALSTMGCNYGDIDNDGFLDFYLGTGAPDYRAVVPNRFMKNNLGTEFVDQTFALNLGHIQKGHGIAFADLDNDGDQDIYAVMGGAFKGDKFPNALFENPGNSNNWIKLSLQGVGSNRSAIGAKIQVKGITEKGDSLTVYKTVSSGASFGANSLLSQIGLANMQSITSVSIMWPNGTGDYTHYDALNTRANYFIKEGEQPQEYSLESFEFNKNDKKEHNHNHHSNTH